MALFLRPAHRFGVRLAHALLFLGFAGLLLCFLCGTFEFCLHRFEIILVAVLLVANRRLFLLAFGARIPGRPFLAGLIRLTLSLRLLCTTAGLGSVLLVALFAALRILTLFEQILQQVTGVQRILHVRVDFEYLLIGINRRFDFAEPRKCVAEVIQVVNVFLAGESGRARAVFAGTVLGDRLPDRSLNQLASFHRVAFIEFVLSLLIFREPQVLPAKRVHRFGDRQQEYQQYQDQATAKRHCSHRHQQK